MRARLHKNVRFVPLQTGARIDELSSNGTGTCAPRPKTKQKKLGKIFVRSFLPSEGDQSPRPSPPPSFSPSPSNLVSWGLGGRSRPGIASPGWFSDGEPGDSGGGKGTIGNPPEDTCPTLSLALPFGPGMAATGDGLAPAPRIHRGYEPAARVRPPWIFFGGRYWQLVIVPLRLCCRGSSWTTRRHACGPKGHSGTGGSVKGTDLRNASGEADDCITFSRHLPLESQPTSTPPLRRLSL